MFYSNFIEIIERVDITFVISFVVILFKKEIQATEIISICLCLYIYNHSHVATYSPVGFRIIGLTDKLSLSLSLTKYIYIY